MLPGYNTNGFAHHRIEDALNLLREIGYRAVAITPDYDLLDPPDARGVPDAVRRLAPVLERSGLHPTVETGARFTLDSRRKHQPTLVSASAEGRRRRLAYLKAAVDVAAAIGADVVSLWSGSPDDDAPSPVLWKRLVAGATELLDYAAERGIHLGFEPEPGMFIDTMAQFAQLTEQCRHPAWGLTLDVGHVFCLGDGDLTTHIQTWAGRLYNVHLEDMRRGVHEHLPFGQGEMEFGPVFAALHQAGYAGPVHVELPRHSHDAVSTARRAFEFLQAYLSHAH